MSSILSRLVATAIVCIGLLRGGLVWAEDALDITTVHSIVQKHCIGCHGPDVQEGEVRFDKLTGKPAEASVWASILKQLHNGAMPPKDESRLSGEEHDALTGWIEQNFAEAAQSAARRMQLPENGNLVPHDQLFNPKAAAEAPKIAASPARLWRTMPASYEHKLANWLTTQGAKPPPAVIATSDLGSPAKSLPAPFGLHAGRELKNYSALYTVEGPQTATLANNARLALNHLLAAEGKNDTSLIRKLAGAKEPPRPEDVDRVIVDLYKYWAGRSPEEDELTADRASILQSVKKLGNRDGLIAGLVPIMIQPEAVFHVELGVAQTPEKPTMLSPRELVDALDRALRDRRGMDLNRKDADWQIAHGDPMARDYFVVAANNGKLNSREDVLAVLEQMAADERLPRLSQAETVGRFLDEYFDYTHYYTVFKCRDEIKKQAKEKRLLGAFAERLAPGGAGPDKAVVSKTRAVIDKILEQDKQVFAQLLTISTDDLGRSDASYEAEFAQQKAALENSFQDIARRLDSQNLDAKTRESLEKESARRQKILDDYLAIGRNRFKLGSELVEIGPPRIGVLNQRSWLISHSSNVDNDAVRRGKWIRERLLGGRIPDVPIGVDAAIPVDPEKTLRERMQKTRKAECWKCHRLMDPLGLPFEQYDHFGSYREVELDKPVDATGEIIDSGDPALDGPVAGPEELVTKLAKSQHVEQVFVRHAFRFWMGRNETLDDARTIQDAYRAYKESDGSMSALLTSLLTSDAFLYRTSAMPEHTPAN